MSNQLQILTGTKLSVLPATRVNLDASFAASSLLNNIVAYWKLDEASGTRNDSVGSNNLTDNNTVTRNTGKLNFAAEFTRSNGEYLSLADNTALSMGDIDFTICAWAYVNDTQSEAVCGKYASPTDKEYLLAVDQSPFRARFYVSGDGSSASFITANSFGEPPTATWFFIIGWHDATANTINIQVNNGTVDSSSYSSGVFDGGSTFEMGAFGNTNYLWDGRIDGVGIWKRVLTSDERTTLYNAGNGLDYPFV